MIQIIVEVEETKKGPMSILIKSQGTETATEKEKRDAWGFLQGARALLGMMMKQSGCAASVSGRPMNEQEIDALTESVLQQYKVLSKKSDSGSDPEQTGN